MTRLRFSEAGPQDISMDLPIQYSMTLGGLDDWSTAMLGSSYGAPGLLGLGSMTLAESRQAEASQGQVNGFCVAAVAALGFTLPMPKPRVHNDDNPQSTRHQQCWSEDITLADSKLYSISQP